MRTNLAEFWDTGYHAGAFLTDAPIEGNKLQGFRHWPLAKQYIYTPLFTNAKSVYACRVNLAAEDTRVMSISQLFRQFDAPDADGLIRVQNPQLILDHPLAHLMCGSYLGHAREHLFSVGWYMVFDPSQLPMVLRVVSFMPIYPAPLRNEASYVKALKKSARQIARQGDIVVLSFSVCVFSVIYPEVYENQVQEAVSFVNNRVLDIQQGRVKNYPDYIPENLFKP